MKKIRSYALTLAETLITLTIVGVIATTTLPNLISKYKKYSVEVGVKEAYSIANNIFNASVADNGATSEWDRTLDSEAFLKKYITPYIKQKDRVRANTNASQEYYQRNTAYSHTYFYTSLNNNLGFNLSNGMNLFIITPDSRSTHPIAALSFDINGKKRPNRAGYDIFTFFFTGTPSTSWSWYRGPEKDNTIDTCTGLPDGTCSTSIDERINHSDGCNATSTSYYNGQSCARVIQLNSWKIPNNYPIKF